MKEKHLEFINSIISMAEDIKHEILKDNDKLDAGTLSDLRKIDQRIDDLNCYLLDC